MKRLIVVRHAKATHKPGYEDFDRPLTGRGRRDAIQAGLWLRDQGFLPELVLCSPARRTKETWDRLAAAMDGTIEIHYDQRLYGASDDETLDMASATPGDVTTLMIVGHNPTSQQVASVLTGQGDLAFPTCAIAVIDLGSWARLVPGAGEARALWTPASASP